MVERRSFLSGCVYPVVNFWGEREVCDSRRDRLFLLFEQEQDGVCLFGADMYPNISVSASNMVWPTSLLYFIVNLVGEVLVQRLKTGD